MRIVQAGTHIKGYLRGVGLGEHIVLDLGIDATAFKLLVEDAQLGTNRQRATKQVELQGILNAQALVGEESQLVVHQLQAHAMKLVQQADGHIGPDVHGAGSILEAHERHSIGSRDSKLQVLSGCGGIEKRLQRPIMRKGRLLLCPCAHGKHQETGHQDKLLLKHVINNDTFSSFIARISIFLRTFVSN